jgi:hypothetical protein
MRPFYGSPTIVTAVAVLGREHMTFRQLWVLILAMTTLGFAGAVSAAENDTDRPGSDYTSFTIPPFTGGAPDCESACTRDARCRAWTFVRAGGPAGGGQCYLKERVPAANPNTCCISGVKESPPSGGGGGSGAPRSGITIYEHTDFDGSSQNYTDDQPNLVSEGWNDIISSFKIARGESWEVCTDVDFRGPCRTFTGDQSNLVSIGWNDRISSFRRVRGGGGGGPGPGVPPPGDDYDIGPGMRDGVDRPGGDYRSFTPSRREGPAACQNTCEDENECRAWAFKRPGGPGERGRCYLKGVQPAETRDPSVISGVSRNRDTISRGMEDNTDRPGSDYRSVDLTDADPRLCQRECERDRSCRAWTYVRPGVQGEDPKCYLKAPAPGATRDGCCVSGTVGPVGPGPGPGPGAPFAENTRREGSVLSNFRTFEGPGACRTACSANSRCADWTYGKPSRPGRAGRCWLFRPGSTPLPDGCCTSSRGGAGGGGGREVIGPGMRDNTDRPGFDLRPPFPLMAPDPALCREACFAEFGCRAWVYSRPGTRHPTRATCTLKSVPGPRTDAPCCITGGRSSLF